uniref:CDP-diacylglycerol--glycerol-3-phosphate 3-phosphatidyltransferase n=1 Tax=uncultured Planctomycetota bacterium TaxID=120965 RepID=H5SCT2_9BACT|nr:CDP-diacylglycerol--glycerol-3-phosphate 3-phosphatidyltransferase [uncultured Planctomycetota bacterium]
MTATLSRSPVHKPIGPVWTWPNLLTAVRFVLCVPLFVCILRGWWWSAVALLVVAVLSDWLDGWLARRTKTTSPLGRNLDPLADKVLVCGSLIFLMSYKSSGLADWMVAIIVIRELLVTSLRSVIEQSGTPFGAAFMGKLKMVLQALALLAVVIFLALEQGQLEWVSKWRQLLGWGRDCLLYATVAVTALSGLQYLWRAYAVFRQSV